MFSPYPTSSQTFYFSPRSPRRSLNPSTLHTTMTRNVSTPLHHIMSQHKLTPTLPLSLPFRCECGPLTNSGTARSTSPIHFCVGTVFCPFPWGMDGIDGMAHTLLRRARRGVRSALCRRGSDARFTRTDSTSHSLPLSPLHPCRPKPPFRRLLPAKKQIGLSWMIESGIKIVIVVVLAHHDDYFSAGVKLNS